MTLNQNIEYKLAKQDALDYLIYKPVLNTPEEIINIMIKDKLNKIEKLAKQLDYVDDYNNFKSITEQQIIQYGTKYAIANGKLIELKKDTDEIYK